MDAKHIKRDYPAYNIKRNHYDKDYCMLEIFRYNKKMEQMYFHDKGAIPSSNTKLYNWRAWTGISGSNNEDFSITNTYIAPEDGEYRLQCLYSIKDDQPGYNVRLTIYVDDVKLEPFTNAGAFCLTMKRYGRPVQLTKGKHIIKYVFSHNVVWVGSAIKRTEIYKADSNNQYDLTMTKATYKKGGMANVDELTCELSYDHSLNESALPTDPDANPSGFIFDFRDEVNLYVGTTEGNTKRVFGGYISTVSVNTDITIMTLSCASRLTDLDKRYCLFEMAIGGGDNEYSGSYVDGISLISTASYTGALSVLTRSVEFTLKTNIPDGAKTLGDNMKIPFYLDFSGKGRDKNPAHYRSENITSSWIDEGFFVRNNATANALEYMTLWDTDFYPQLEKKGLEITDAPIFYLDYLMLEPKTETEITTANGISTGATVDQKTLNGIPQSVVNFAMKATNSKDPNTIALDCLHYIKYNVNYSWYKNFVHDGDYVIAHKLANCCDGTRLWAEMCACHGVIVEFIHVPNHVFGRFNGRWYDWCASIDRQNRYEHVMGSTILQTSTYPTKPF